MNIPILLEDTAMLVINKPPSVVVNRAQSVKTQTIQDWLEDKFPELKNKPPRTTNVKPVKAEGEEVVYDPVVEFYNRSGIVHRIDKETSGILLITKTPESFSALKQQFMDRTVKKSYLAIIHELMPSQEGTINAPIGRLPWNKEQFGVVPDGKESQTRYKVLASYSKEVKKKKERYQLVECFPETGRTHQIRVHLKYINRPILGDYLYAGRKTARDDRTWVPRVMLHAANITFNHPTTSESVNINAPIPEDMQQVLSTLHKTVQ